MSHHPHDPDPHEPDHGEAVGLPWVPQPRKGAEHLGRDLPAEPSPLELIELAERLRAFVAAHTTAPYEIDTSDPLAREACWALAAFVADKPIRDAAEVTALWYVARRHAQTGASVRRLGKLLEPAVIWLSPEDEGGLPIRSRFAFWMVSCGGERARFGPLRAVGIYRELVPVLTGHGVSRARPMEMWREILTGLSELCDWAGGPGGRHGEIAVEVGLAYARLASQVGRRAEAVSCFRALHRQLRELDLAAGRRPETDLTLLDIELDLRALGALPPD
ncbi:hypothetical protein [Raineyella fluvialis]|uniref:Uncharacterized protein n=1 Tax=Raineyella fluvialis TaxID=2662261 RepID=A0A5Q2FEM0_9ACTN|nr:hypothetical protein [Raineyella fluvialis]QGF22726.1 hypothetical protein Rai3103_02420 [Raineyella fluvialis]